MGNLEIKPGGEKGWKGEYGNESTETDCAGSD